MVFGVGVLVAAVFTWSAWRVGREQARLPADAPAGTGAAPASAPAAAR
jgi:hypothetical protein